MSLKFYVTVAADSDNTTDTPAIEVQTEIGSAYVTFVLSAPDRTISIQRSDLETILKATA